MKYKLIVLLFFNYFFIDAQELQLYIGTFTNENSKGIYKATFNSETGDLSTPELAISIDDPGFLAYSPDRKYLYSANAKGFASSYKINEDGTLSLLTRVGTHGKGACHIAVNSEGSKAVVSTYGGGTVLVFPINDDGSLAPASQVFDHNTENEKARAHSAQFYKDELFVADLGRNALYHYELNSKNYELQSEAIVPMEGNPGPRHFALTKDGQFIYVINEYGGSITSIMRTDSGFKQIDFDSTLDENYDGPNSCADIHLSKGESFLYGSNRGENSIAIFERNTKNGKITKIQNISVRGDWPRNFTLDPTGKFLLVANKKSNNISVFKVDKASGKLSFLHDAKTPTPVCLLF